MRRNESISPEQLIADSPTRPIVEVIKAGARTAPSGDALLADIIRRHDGKYLDELTIDELRDDWRYYQQLDAWPYPAAEHEQEGLFS